MLAPMGLAWTPLRRGSLHMGLGPALRPPASRPALRYSCAGGCPSLVRAVQTSAATGDRRRRPPLAAAALPLSPRASPSPPLSAAAPRRPSVPLARIQPVPAGSLPPLPEETEAEAEAERRRQRERARADDLYHGHRHRGRDADAASFRRPWREHDARWWARHVGRPTAFALAVVLGSTGVLAYLAAQRRWFAQADAERHGALWRLLGAAAGGGGGGGGGGSTRDQHAWQRAAWSLFSGANATWALVGINVAVFALWCVPRLGPRMARHGLHDPRSGLAHTLLTSAFSHSSFMHLAFNMAALVSFAPLCQQLAFPGSPESFLALYLSAAVSSSLASHLASVLGFRQLVLPSLGASGALWALLALFWQLAPHAPVGIMFIPHLRFEAGDLIPFLVGADVAGLFFGWTYFDHVAHLGGMVTGYWYAHYGRTAWLRLQHRLEQHRHALSWTSRRA